MKRRNSMVGLSQQGEEIVIQSLNAGQSTSSLQVTLTTFNDKWERLLTTLQGENCILHS